MFFNRFDICEAYWCFACDYGLYKLITRLEQMQFKPSLSLKTEYLNDNEKLIYDNCVLNLKLHEEKYL